MPLDISTPSCPLLLRCTSLLVAERGFCWCFFLVVVSTFPCHRLICPPHTKRKLYIGWRRRRKNDIFSISIPELLPEIRKTVFTVVTKLQKTVCSNKTGELRFLSLRQSFALFTDVHAFYESCSQSNHKITTMHHIRFKQIRFTHSPTSSKIHSYKSSGMCGVTLIYGLWVTGYKL